MQGRTGCHVFYCYYLASYRTDAYLQNLCRDAAQVTVLDFSPLRSLFRGKAIDGAYHTSEQIRKYGSLGAKLNYHTLPTISHFPGGWGQRMNLALSAVLALLFSPLMSIKLLFSKFDHVVFYNGHLLFLCLLLSSWIKKIPYTTDLGDVLYLIDNPNPLTRRVELAFLKHSRSIVCVSKPFKEHLINQYRIPPDRISILSAAIPENFILQFSEESNRSRQAQLRAQIGADDQATVLVYSGGIWKKRLPGIGIKDVQGVESLCEAFEQMNETGHDTWLVLLGYSKEAKELDRFRNGRWRQRLVELGTYAPGGPEHLAALGGADYLCLPSFPCDTYRLYDRFKTIEYLAAGKRILAADTAINHYLLGDAGCYYKEGSSESMAQSLIQNRAPKAIFIESSHLKVQRDYNWDQRNREHLVSKVVLEHQTIESY